MTSDEMKAQLKKGVNPLALAIKKWEDIAANKGFNKGLGNCALCELYLFDLEGEPCTKCVVYSRTGKQGCNGTPYPRFVYHVPGCADCDDFAYHPRYCNEAIEIAKEELEFLNSLEKEVK